MKFEVLHNEDSLLVKVDSTKILEAEKIEDKYYNEEGIKPFKTPLSLSKEQVDFLRTKVPNISNKIEVYLEKIEIPYVYRWTVSDELYDGAITFKFKLSDDSLIEPVVIIAYGQREAHGQQDRKRLLLIGKFSRSKKSVELNVHGRTFIVGEPTGSDNYEKGKYVVTLIQKQKEHGSGHYEPEDYRNIPVWLKEFVAKDNGKLLTQKNFIKSPYARDKLVFYAHITDTENLVKYALLRVFGRI